MTTPQPCRNTACDHDHTVLTWADRLYCCEPCRRDHRTALVDALGDPNDPATDIGEYFVARHIEMGPEEWAAEKAVIGPRPLGQAPRPGYVARKLRRWFG